MGHKEELEQSFKLGDYVAETIMEYASQVGEVYTKFERPPALEERDETLSRLQ